MNILVELTKGLPIGTNLALLQFLWMLVSGALLPQRGALFPALKASGLSDPAIRRAWAAFRGGVWQTAVVLRLWQAQIEGLPGWQVHRHEGYRAIVVDTTAFWRPALRNCPSKHYHPSAQLHCASQLPSQVLKAIYQDRWSVERIPLAAKQMVGAHRQFVHAEESNQRLPELSLLTGSLLSFLAATVPPTPTGF